jgi:hypothetical protein
MSRPTLFRLPLSQVGGRLDPHFYQASSINLLKKLHDAPYPKRQLRELISHRCVGDWGEDEDFDNSAEQYRRCLVIRSTEFDEGLNLKLDGDRKKHRKILRTKLQRMCIEEGDIFIEKSGGSPDQPVGRVAFLDSSAIAHGDLAYSNFIEKIKPAQQHVDPVYLFYYLGMLHSIGVTDRLQSQTNGIRNLMMNDYLKLPVSLPPRTQQNQIATLMRDAYAQKAALEAQAKALLESVDAVLYQHLGLVPPTPKADDLSQRIFKVPVSTITGRLDPYANHPKLRHWAKAVKSGPYGFAPLHKLVQFKKVLVTSIPEGLGYVGLENILSLDGTYADTSEKTEINSAVGFKAGNILFPKLRPNLNKTHLARADGVCSTEFHVLQAIDISTEYLLAYLRSKAVVSVLSELVTGNTLPRLQTEDIFNLLVITPPIGVQKKIAQEITSLHTQAHTLRQQAQDLLERAKQELEHLILGTEMDN